MWLCEPQEQNVSLMNHHDQLLFVLDFVFFLLLYSSGKFLTNGELQCYCSSLDLWEIGWSACGLLQARR